MEHTFKSHFSKRDKLSKIFNRDKYLWMMILFPLIYYIVFKYIPMYGLIISFENFSPYRGILKGPWVGFKYFIEFFNSTFFWRLMRNTFLLNVYSIIFGFPAPIILALIVNGITAKFYKKSVQTISYLPHFVSTVVVVGMVVNFLSPTTGLINHVLSFFGQKPINFMIMPRWFRTIYIASGIWQEVGWSSIIYLAALSGVDSGLYEAAKVDGANKIQQTIFITLPSILPTIIIMLILRMGNMLSVGAEKVLLMYNPLTYEVADVINTYVYRIGIGNSEFSYGSAVGLFQSAINFILVASVNKISKKVSEISLW
ncbi:MAG: ABC transporter permease subunit [Clostridiales bacterium]|nr:ABC transporter permease subunit [Clostridiales bacterium]